MFYSLRQYTKSIININILYNKEYVDPFILKRKGIFLLYDAEKLFFFLFQQYKISKFNFDIFSIMI